jgi:hypothetical protein
MSTGQQASNEQGGSEATNSEATITNSVATKNFERTEAIRRRHRGVVTKLTNEVSSYYSTEEKLPEATLYRLEIIDQNLEIKLRVLEELNQQVLGVCEVEEIETEIEEAEAIL